MISVHIDIKKARCPILGQQTNQLKVFKFADTWVYRYNLTCFADKKGIIPCLQVVKFVNLIIVTISGKKLRVIVKIIQFENLTEKSFAFIKVNRQIID